MLLQIGSNVLLNNVDLCDIPNKLSHLLRACWQENPNERPTANALQKQLQKFLLCSDSNNDGDGNDDDDGNSDDDGNNNNYDNDSDNSNDDNDSTDKDNNGNDNDDSVNKNDGGTDNNNGGVDNDDDGNVTMVVLMIIVTVTFRVLKNVTKLKGSFNDF